MKFPTKITFVLFLFLGLELPSYAQLTTGFTFSRQNGQSNSSSSSSVVLGTSRVLGASCKSQIQTFYKKNNILDSSNQGCIVSPKNVIALPSHDKKLDQFKILDISRGFAVSDSISSKTIENTLSQKSVNSFSSYGYSVFSAP
jgi:hypothetical protein